MKKSGYQKNNILFRISSSEAISKFKNSQAIVLLQLVRKELDFEQGAREAVLLEYDRFSTWVFMIERLYLVQNSRAVTDKLRQETLETFCNTVSDIEGIMQDNTDVFSQEIIEYVKILHDYSKNIIEHQFNRILQNTTSEAFSQCVKVVDLFLQHMLVSIHEFNNNTRSSARPFLCATDFFDGYDRTDSTAAQLTARGKYFIKNHGCKNFEFKNYSSEDLLGSLTIKLATKGISIYPEKMVEVIDSGFIVEKA